MYLDCEDGAGYRQINRSGGGSYTTTGLTSGWGLGEMEALAGADRTDSHPYQQMIVDGVWQWVAGVQCRTAFDSFNTSTGYRVALGPGNVSAIRTDQSQSKWGCP